MNLLIEQGALQKALSRVTGVVASRNTIAILDNVAIDARDGEVWLTATDLIIEAKAKVPGAVIVEEGDITASGTMLAGLVQSTPAGAEIALVFSDGDPRLKVMFGRSKYHLPVLPRADFPVLKPLEGASTVGVQAVDLKSMITRVAFAQSNELKARPYLCGVHLHAPDGKLRMVATNGHRLALADAPAVGLDPAFADVILPTKAISEFARALDAQAGPVTLLVSPRAVVLMTEDAAIRTKVIDGSPVDYMRVVPQAWSAEAVVQRAPLAAIVKRIAQISDNKERTIKLSFEGSQLTLQAHGGDSSQGKEELEIAYGGPAFEISFNARYVMDALAQTEADEVVFRMTDKASPSRLEPSVTDPEHGPVLSILLPQLS